MFERFFTVYDLAISSKCDVMDIAIINYGMGNLISVKNAFAYLNCSAQIISDPSDLKNARKIVLPGVGAFKEGMDNLNKLGWKDELEAEVIQKKKPFLGICLGMQLLATEGTEYGSCQGLGWIPGRVDKLATDDKDLHIPHIGWDDIQITKPGKLLKGIPESSDFYFIHSFVFHPDDTDVTGSTCNYGEKFVASIELNNIFGTQFHPEKSQKNGLSILSNFIGI